MENEFGITHPPLGLTPEFIVKENRVREIDEAMWRYATRGYKVPYEWLKEKEEIVNWLAERKVKKELSKEKERIPLFTTEQEEEIIKIIQKVVNVPARNWEYQINK